MNVKINKNEHEYLCSLNYKEYLFGSQLHGIASANSDEDYIRVIDDSFYDNFTTLGKFLPNIHSWQYDDHNKQYVWMTERQFYYNLFSGDGNMIADVVLLSGEFEDALFLCRTYKIIKGYLGVAKRDLKLHGNVEKKRFHATRSLYMANKLMSNQSPSISDIVDLKNSKLQTREELFEIENRLRVSLNLMLDSGKIDMVPKFIETNSLAQIMINCNNIREFKY